MKLCAETNRPQRARATQAFTLVEAVVMLGLMVILIATTLSAILGMQITSRRTSDYTAAMAVAEAKLMDIRGVYYRPPVSPFTYSTVYVTNQDTVALNQAGTAFQVTGTVISKIEYLGSMGHLVTVTVTQNTTRKPITVSLQAVVNGYSGGEQ